MTKQQQIENQVRKHKDSHFRDELVIGSLRYEALRKLSPRQYAELYKRNMDGENFDDMVDEIMLTNHRCNDGDAQGNSGSAHCVTVKKTKL